LQEEEEEEFSEEELEEVKEQALRETGKLMDQLTGSLPKFSDDTLKLMEEELPMQESKEESAEKDFASLNEEQKKIFSYFIQVAGMEEQIVGALEGSRLKKKDNPNSNIGNIILIGEHQSGKTRLATFITKTLKKASGETGKHLGKIHAEKLNHKDIAKTLSSMTGGYLLIEKAGDLSYETITRLSLLMEQETGGLLVLLEDDRAGIKKLMEKDPNFIKKFTEQVKIPIFTSDELVIFARFYAHEKHYIIDDMGILAVYDSISKIQKPDEAITLADVANIIDEAIGRIKKGGIHKVIKRGRYRKDGFTLLMEKDFEN
jgi:hypothetical protein